jgi:uncharacterized protein YneF (UPF0154 family)
MDTTVLIAIIGAIATIVGTIITVLGGQKQIREDLRAHNEVQDERIRTLTKTVEKHNSLIERTYKLEARVDALEKRQ